MKFVLSTALVHFCFITLPLSAQAQEEVKLELSKPGKPFELTIHKMSGGITVTGHDKDYLVFRLPKFSMEEPQSNNRGEGLRKIQANSQNVEIEEIDNRVSLTSKNWKSRGNIEVLVPFKANLKLSCLNEGNILVENVDGQLEVQNTNGGITLSNISGSVIANALNEDLKVSFQRIDPDKAMSFTSLNGNLDIAFPNSLDATMLLETHNGDIYTAFEIDLRQEMQRDEKKNGDRRRIAYKSQIIGTVGKGGPEITLKTFNGNIYIRKSE